MVYPYSPVLYLSHSLKDDLEYDATVSKRVKSFLTPLSYSHSSLLFYCCSIHTYIYILLNLDGHETHSSLVLINRRLKAPPLLKVDACITPATFCFSF